MPNTLIREGYLDSDRISSLSDFDDRVFFRVLLAADDAGRTDGRVDKLRSALFPTREKVRGIDVEKSVGRLIAVGLLSRWEWDRKPIIQVMRWQRRSGAVYSKFPNPDGSFKVLWIEIETRDGKHTFSATSIPMGERRVNEPIDNPSEGGPPKPTETNTETNTETKTKTKTGAAFAAVVTAKGVEIPALLASDPRLLEAWRTWEEHLREKKVKTTVVADRKQLAQCCEWGIAEAIAAIDRSIANNYQGIFPASGSQPARKKSGDDEDRYSPGFVPNADAKKLAEMAYGPQPEDEPEFP